MLVRSICLGAIEAKHPGSYPRFFEVDWAPDILKFVRRHDGEYYRLNWQTRQRALTAYCT
jgi:hypothetical protein